MRKKKSKFQKKILYSAWTVFAILVVIIVVFAVLIYREFDYAESKKIYNVLIVITTILLLLLYRVYEKNILKPVNTLEDALKILEKANEGRNITLSVNPESLSDSLTIVLERLKASLEREHAEIVLRQESEYAELQSQINPHFLYNTLETIRGQAIIDDNYKIADMTEALAKYFRYNIGKDNDEVTLSEEIENIYNYIHIQQYRFENKFKFYVYTHEEAKEYLDCVIPKMTLQPIVENAIFHGVEGKIEQGHISIHIETTKERLIIRVADDGIGMDEQKLRELNEKLNSANGVALYNKKDSHNGIAMDNVNSRIKLLFGKEYGISISSTRMVGTEVEVCIPRVVQEAK